MIFSSRSYAIGMAHHQIAGGFRTMGLLLGAYAAVVGTILGLLFYNVEPAELPRAMQGIFTFLFVVEAILLVIIGALRIAGCIRIDLTTGMIDSHRLMPLHASRAVLGYLFGTTSHILSLVLLNLLVMAGAGAYAGVTFGDMVMSQFVLAFFSLFAWTFAAMGTLMFRQALPLMVLALIFGSISSTLLRRFGILPGVSVLASPFLGETIFNLSNGRFNMRAAYPLAFMAQAAFAVIFFLAACRRYRDAHVVAFSVPLGIAMVTVWGVLTAISIRIWPEESAAMPFARFNDQPPLYGQIVAGLTVAALLMLVPLYSLTHMRKPPSLMIRVTAMLSLVLAAALPAAGGALQVRTMLLTLLVLACHAVAIHAIFRLLRGGTAVVAGIGVLGFFFVLWAAPLLIEFIRVQLLAVPARSAAPSLIPTLSPLGLLIACWDPDSTQPLAVGIVVQVLAAGGLHMLAFRRKGPGQPTSRAPAAKIGSV